MYVGKYTRLFSVLVYTARQTRALGDSEPLPCYIHYIEVYANNNQNTTKYANFYHILSLKNLQLVCVCVIE